ncbi:MAG TPA: phosphoglycolate phosphatase [Methanomassiliicoccales archaeon]|nr:phosphoglycolate phosphatase [Methanomassiliicoccales archaeon]
MLLIRAVISDIDGTLTDSNQYLQSEGLEALRAVQQSGTTVMLASGNVLPLALGVATYIGARGPIIAENGGIVSYNEKVYHLNKIDQSLKAYAYLKERIPEVERLFTDKWRESEVALKVTVDPERVRDELRDWDVRIEATGFAIHIMEKDHSKLRGAKKACELIGIDISEAAAFGDSDNDVDLLASAGYGVAVGNASPRARKAAKYVAREENAKGVVEGLRKLGLL